MSLGTAGDGGGAGRKHGRSRPRTRTQTRTKKPISSAQVIVHSHYLAIQLHLKAVGKVMQRLNDQRDKLREKLYRLQTKQCKHPNRIHVPERDGIFRCPDCGYSN